MKIVYMYNKIGVPSEYFDISVHFKNYISYEQRDFLYEAMDTLWLECTRKKTNDVLVEVETGNENLYALLHRYNHCNYFLVFNDLNQLKDKDYITIDRIPYERALEYLNKRFPNLKHKEEIARKMSLGKMRVKELKSNTGHSLGF